MDRSGNATFFSSASSSSPVPPAPHHRHPEAPLALSEFLARTPISDYTYLHEEPATSPQTTKVGVVDELMPSPADKIQADFGFNTCPSVSRFPAQTDHAPPPSPLVAKLEEKAAAAPYNWQATRLQLLPSRNQGKKADWIRGWSEAVGRHGDEAYCACVIPSDVPPPPKKEKVKRTELAGGVRAILQGGASSSKVAVDHGEPEACNHCSRPSLPPITLSPGDTDENGYPKDIRSLGKKMGDLLRRVRPDWSSESRSWYKRDPEVLSIIRPRSQPRWPHTRLSFQFSVPGNKAAHKSKSMDATASWRRASSSSSLEDLSHLEGPRGARGTSRLQRAAALLQRAKRPHG